MSHVRRMIVGSPAWNPHTTVALVTMLPTIALIAFYASKLQPKWRTVHDLHGAMTTVIQENIAGVRVVKAFAREQGEVAKFRGRKETYLDTLLDTVNYWASRVPRAQFLYGLSTPLVLWIGGRQVSGSIDQKFAGALSGRDGVRVSSRVARRLLSHARCASAKQGRHAHQSKEHVNSQRYPKYPAKTIASLV